MPEIPVPDPISTKLKHIAKLAREDSERSFHSLAHHIDVCWLKRAFHSICRNAAAGIDGVTAAEYEQNLMENLQVLLDRFKSGRYKAPAVRRVYIPKAKGGQVRPLGIPTLEDKILQKSVTMILGVIYEQDFRYSSFGFRPRRGAHQALECLRTQLMKRRCNWVIEIDIQQFFDTVDHNCLRIFLDQRIRDGVLRRTIGKWLNAGYLENG